MKRVCQLATRMPSDNNVKRVLISGPPACGKGTQAALLARMLGVPHFSLGEMLRVQIARGGEIGSAVKDYVAAGQPIPVDSMKQAVHARLVAEDIRRGFVGDGLVRTSEQASALDSVLSELKMPLQRSIYLEIPDQEVRRRTRDRQVCERCGRVYTYVGAQSLGGVCDADGQHLIRRADDSPELVEKRLISYHEHASSVIGHYQSGGILARTDGARPVGTVHLSIVRIVSEAW